MADSIWKKLLFHLIFAEERLHFGNTSKLDCAQFALSLHQKTKILTF